MHRNKYILAICLIILVSIGVSRYKEDSKVQKIVNVIENSSNKAQAFESTSSNSIDESILIPDTVNIKNTVTKDASSDVAESPKVEKPYISAKSYLVGNIKTGEIYSSLNIDEVYPIASISKLYTSLVVNHLYDKELPVTITAESLLPYGSAGDLAVGERYEPEDLLYALLLESSNDAAQAFALSFGYDDFIYQMNSFAREIGMQNTSFEDPSGLSPSNISNIRDLFTLSRYLYRNEKDLLNISKTVEKSIASTSDHLAHTFENINPYSRDEKFIGGKTGRTDEARESMLSLFNTRIDGKSYPIAIIILRSDFGQREIDTERLLDRFVDNHSEFLSNNR